MILHPYKKYENIDLKLVSLKHERTWEFYCQQYIKALSLLFDVAAQRDYLTNSRHMPFLFLLRHSLELFLKSRIYARFADDPEYTFPQTHNLFSLAKELGEDLHSFQDKFGLLRCESEGDCFRYLTDKNNTPFFHGEELNSFDTCQNFISYYNSHKVSDTNQLRLFEDNRFIRNELYFYTRECQFLGVYATHYDDTVFVFLDKIHESQVNVNEIYLPLLFLIRHSLELKLKFQLLNLGDVFSDSLRKISTHSVFKLWNFLSDYIDDAIAGIKDTSFQTESIKLRDQSRDFKDLIHLVDAQSTQLRFPIDQKGNLVGFTPSKTILEQVVHLYCSTDSFVTFAVEVLNSAGYLEVGDDIMRKMME